MIRIDGSLGEGGGQILRSALALSVITGKPFEIHSIRAKREKPGLMRQHLTAVQAAKAISRAQTAGAEIGSRNLLFEPQPPLPGTYDFAVGTAGSAMLVFQTVFLPLVFAGGPSTVRLRGGTHNPLAPPFDYVDRCFLPLLRRMGVEADIELRRPGFYPAGGGDFTAIIKPCSKLQPLDILERSPFLLRQARAVVAGLPRHIAERELRVVQTELSFAAHELVCEEMNEQYGPGNVITVSLQAAHGTEVFTGFGEKTKRAEAVAQGVCREAQEYIAAGAPIGVHSADQLLLPFALAGSGSFRTAPLSRHSITNMEIISLFLSIECSWAEQPDGTCIVTVES